MLFIRQMSKLGWLLLDSLILISLVVLFFLTRHPIHLTWSKPRPQATLVYSSDEVIVSPAIEGIGFEDHGGSPVQLALNRNWIAWGGARLAQQVNAKGEHLREDGLFVYHFATQQRKFIGPADSRVHLENDTLYFGRKNLTYAYNLNTDTQRLLPTPPKSDDEVSNSTYRFWTEAYPEICKKALTCQEEYKYECKKEFFFADHKTQTRHSLGMIGRYTNLWQATETHLLLFSFTPPSICAIKGSSGTFSVVDLTSGQGWPIREYGQENSMRFINLTGNILVYTFLGAALTHSHVVQFIPGQTPVTLFYSERMVLQGIAGDDVLLYTPIPEHESWPQKGLVARNFKTGWTQTLDEINFITGAKGDNQHFAWTTYGGDLYVVPANLQPAPSATPHSQPDSPLLKWEPWQLKPVK